MMAMLRGGVRAAGAAALLVSLLAGCGLLVGNVDGTRTFDAAEPTADVTLPLHDAGRGFIDAAKERSPKDAATSSDTSLAKDHAVEATRDTTPATDHATDAPKTVDADSIAFTMNLSGANLDLSLMAGRPTTPVAITLILGEAAVISSTSSTSPAITTGTLPPGSTATIVNHGMIVGAGGAGGSGGNGGGGTGTPCGRPGIAGGTAIELTVNTVIMNSGTIFGGGGGGAGASGCNENAGGGGGGGVEPGEGGAGASSLSMATEIAYCGQDNGIRQGAPGSPGNTSGGGGVGGVSGTGVSMVAGGQGGGYGEPGQDTVGECAIGGPGGKAGYAIQRNGYSCNVPDGAYATGSGAIRGPVGP